MSEGRRHGTLIRCLGSSARVHPRAALASMHHSRIELTVNLPTDPVLLDVAGAVEALPGSGRRAARAAAGA